MSDPEVPSGPQSPDGPLSSAHAPEDKEAVVALSALRDAAYEEGYEDAGEFLRDAARTEGELREFIREEVEAAVEDEVGDSFERLWSEVMDTKRRVSATEVRGRGDAKADRKEVLLRMCLSSAADHYNSQGRVTTTEVAAEFGVSKQTVRNYMTELAAENPGVVYEQLGGRYRGVNQKGLKLDGTRFEHPLRSEYAEDLPDVE